MDFRAYQGLQVSRVAWFGGLVVLRLQVSRCGISIDKYRYSRLPNFTTLCRISAHSAAYLNPQRLVGLGV